ncbi:hypothetical protein [Haloferax sp. Q22]|uniref:hypothetical protein n=1 Tax=Haloferax sp. (strain Q22) TaxID=1526048 RepID=UPI000737CFD3|nr:hypothetical protein [Haloferax sp. Q22]
MSTLDRFFVGREGAPTRQHRLGGIALFALVFVTHLPPDAVGPLSYPFGLRLWTIAGLGLGGGAVGALRGDGVFGALPLGVGPVLGFFTALGAAELTTPSMGLWQGVATGLVAGGLLASLGFALGFGGCYAVARVPSSG